MHLNCCFSEGLNELISLVEVSAILDVVQGFFGSVTESLLGSFFENSQPANLYNS